MRPFITKYLLDTNILLRASDLNALQHPLARDAIYQLLIQGNQCCLTLQILVEFWVVATRPTDVNGFGWTFQRTMEQISQFLSRFIVLEENAQILENWLKLVALYEIKGKRTHDIRLIAVMQSHGITHLLTFNPRDFICPAGLKIISPDQYLHYS